MVEQKQGGIIREETLFRITKNRRFWGAMVTHALKGHIREEKKILMSRKHA